MSYLVETEIECPACGEWFPIMVDTSQGDYDTVEDCSVCCRPMSVEVRCSPGRVDSAETIAA